MTKSTPIAAGVLAGVMATAGCGIETEAPNKPSIQGGKHGNAVLINCDKPTDLREGVTKHTVAGQQYIKCHR